MRKHIVFISLFILTALFVAIRLYNILSLPLFTDEAIYVRWSQIARFDANWRFISLTDGKQPSFVWFTMTMMRFVHDPLLAGRLVSVISGFFSMIGLFFLGKEMFKNKWVGVIASGLYVIFPMALVYDRMALYDSLVGAFTVWALYFEIQLVRKLRLDTALMLGMVIGAGVLTKTSAFFSIYLLPFMLILFQTGSNWIKRFWRLIVLAAISVIFAYIYYSVLRLSPFYHIINEKNGIFVFPIHEWIKHPLEFFWGNLLGQWDWFIKYVTWPMIALMAGSFIIHREFTKEKLLVVIWFALPFVALALFGRVLYPRFILFMILPLLPLAALSMFWLWNMIKNKSILAVVILLFILQSLYLDYYVLINFPKAPIPYSDLEQYANNWPAGGGVKEIIGFLENEASKGKIYAASEGTFGSLPTYAIEIYLGDNKNVDKGGIWPLPEKVPQDLILKAKTMPVYFVFNQTQGLPLGWSLKFIAKYQKGIGDSYMSLYQVEAR